MKNQKSLMTIGDMHGGLHAGSWLVWSQKDSFYTQHIDTNVHMSIHAASHADPSQHRFTTKIQHVQTGPGHRYPGKRVEGTTNTFLVMRIRVGYGVVKRSATLNHKRPVVSDSAPLDRRLVLPLPAEGEVADLDFYWSKAGDPPYYPEGLKRHFLDNSIAFDETDSKGNRLVVVGMRRQHDAALKIDWEPHGLGKARNDDVPGFGATVAPEGYLMCERLMLPYESADTAVIWSTKAGKMTGWYDIGPSRSVF